MERESLRQELAALTADAKRWVDARRRLGEARVLLEQPLPPGREDLAAMAAPVRPELVLANEAPPDPKPQAPWAASLDAFYLQVRGCQRCSLGASRQHFVFGEGDPQAPLAFVGEAPGADEDAQARPFVGPAGKLLDKIIAAMGYRRSQVYLCNLIKCRPPFNRIPTVEEVGACQPLVEQQLALLRPKVVVALGLHAAQALTGASEGLPQLRSRSHEWRGALLIPTYHPADLLRDAALKKDVWDDMKGALKRLGSSTH